MQITKTSTNRVADTYRDAHFTFAKHGGSDMMFVDLLETS